MQKSAKKLTAVATDLGMRTGDEFGILARVSGQYIGTSEKYKALLYLFLAADP